MGCFMDDSDKEMRAIVNANNVVAAMHEARRKADEKKAQERAHRRKVQKETEDRFWRTVESFVGAVGIITCILLIFLAGYAVGAVDYWFVLVVAIALTLAVAVLSARAMRVMFQWFAFRKAK